MVLRKEGAKYRYLRLYRKHGVKVNMTYSDVVLVLCGLQSTQNASSRLQLLSQPCHYL